MLRLTLTGFSTLPTRVVLPTDEALRAVAVLTEQARTIPGASIVVEAAEEGATRQA